MDVKRIAKIGKGTRRKKREINLLELAEEVKSLYSKHKSLNKIGSIIKLSPEMVRQFLKINYLDGTVKVLIKDGLIKSVDIGYRISKLQRNDQIILAKQVVDRALSSDDVRAVVKYKINNPKIPLIKVIEKVIQSKDKKIYVAYLGIDKDTFNNLSEKYPVKNIREKTVRSLFNDVIHRDLIVSLELNGRVVILKVQKEGAKKLRNKAKELKVPLNRIADTLVKVNIKGNGQ